MSNASSQFQRYDRQHGEHDPHDPEARNDLAFVDPFFLVVMMERRHQEDPSSFTVLALGVFEPRDLQHHAEVFSEKNATEHGDQQFLAHQDRYGGDDASKR